MDVSRPLLILVDQALNHACDSVREGGPLIPFVLKENGEDLTLNRCMVGVDGSQDIDIGASAEHARSLIRSFSGQAERAVAAFDGRISHDGQKSDCLLFEAYEAGGEKSYVFGQRYQPAEDGREFEPLGDPMLLKEDAPLW